MPIVISDLLFIWNFSVPFLFENGKDPQLLCVCLTTRLHWTFSYWIQHYRSLNHPSQIYIFLVYILYKSWKWITLIFLLQNKTLLLFKSTNHAELKHTHHTQYMCMCMCMCMRSTGHQTTSAIHMYTPQEIQWQWKSSLVLYHWANEDKHTKTILSWFFSPHILHFWNKIIYLVL